MDTQQDACRDLEEDNVQEKPTSETYPSENNGDIVNPDKNPSTIGTSELPPEDTPRNPSPKLGSEPMVVASTENPTKTEPLVSEDLSIDSISDDEQKPDKKPVKEDDPEDQPSKKQKSLTPVDNSEQPTPAKTPASGSNKKSSKKKSKGNNVWTKPTSRKGKKKAKNNNNGGYKGDSAVFISPIMRLPDKNDDSPDLKICLSKVYKAEKVDLTDDRLSAGSCKGYRMVRATRGVMEGAWYFEIKVVHLGETGHTRLGWSTEKGDLQAPVGYDSNSFGYRDIDGSKIHKALREMYGEEGYKEGDVIGFYINLPNGNSYAPKLPQLVWYKGQKYVCAPDPKEDPPKIVPGELILYPNADCLFNFSRASYKNMLPCHV